MTNKIDLAILLGEVRIYPTDYANERRRQRLVFEIYNR